MIDVDRGGFNPKEVEGKRTIAQTASDEKRLDGPVVVKKMNVLARRNKCVAESMFT
jgi:hypothetical protein